MFIADGAQLKKYPHHRGSSTYVPGTAVVLTIPVLCAHFFLMFIGECHCLYSAVVLLVPASMLLLITVFVVVLYQV